jgi:hypothetical protein
MNNIDGHFFVFLQLIVQSNGILIGFGMSFFTGYILYLFSSQANVDEKVATLGDEILIIINNKSITRTPLWDDYGLLRKYKNKYPNKNKNNLLENIQCDLHTDFMTNHINDKNNISFLQSCFKDNEYYLGRVFFFLMYQYVENTLNHKPEKDSPISIPFDEKKAFNSNVEQSLFPYGIYGQEDWIDEFSFVRNGYNMLYRYKDIFYDDYKKYLASEGDRTFKEFLLRFDYLNYLTEIDVYIKNIEEIYCKLKTLIRLKISYDQKSKIPYYNKIVIAWSISCLFGVVLPLIITLLPVWISSFNEYHGLILLVLSIPSFVVGVYYFYKGTNYSNIKSYAIKYIYPLSKILVNNKVLANTFITYNYLFINKVLEQVMYKITRQERRLIINYRNSIKKSNEISELCEDQIVNALKNNIILANLSKDLNKGGAIISLFFFLNGNKEINISSNGEYIISADHDGYSRTLFRLSFLKEDGSANIAQECINQIYKDFYKSINYKKLILYRKKLNKDRDHLFDYIQKYKLYYK